MRRLNNHTKKLLAGRKHIFIFISNAFETKQPKKCNGEIFSSTTVNEVRMGFLHQPHMNPTLCLYSPIICRTSFVIFEMNIDTKHGE